VLLFSSLGLTFAQPALTSTPPPSPSDYLKKLAQNTIFIYDGAATPCAHAVDKSALPLGTAFFIGLQKQKDSPEERDALWDFIITAKHVVQDRTRIILRMNTADGSSFTCFPLTLTDANRLFAPSGVDLVSISAPEIPNTTPQVFTPSMLLDEEKMRSYEVGVGTQVFSVGYLYGYSGEQVNYPVTKFGHISVLTDESWFAGPLSHINEKGYIIELQNTPGLSGAPVVTYGFEFKLPFQFRVLPPYLVGVVKALMTAPVKVGPNDGSIIAISQGIAIVEPAFSLKALVDQIVGALRSRGAKVDLN